MEELGLPRYYKFEHQIIRGMSSRALAKILQSEGYYPDIKLESLAATIRSFRKETILAKARRLMELESTTSISEADKTISEQRNIALELSHLIAIQQMRVDKGVAKENTDEKNYAHVHSDIRLLGKLLETYGQFQIKAGMVKSVGLYNYGNYKDNPETDKKIQKFLKDTERQRQIGMATRKALKILSEIDTSKLAGMSDD